MQRGGFVTLEGTEGVGKTTNLEFVADFLRRAGCEVVVTREPGGTRLGESVRELLLDPDNRGMSDAAELLLMFAARAQHLDKVIRPALERGEWVVCDRFTEATYAYQGGGRGIAESDIGLLENWVQRSLRPDLTLLLDAPVELGMERARGRPAAADRFEQEKQAFFERVRARYRAQAERYPGRFAVVDATRDLEAVQAELAAALEGLVQRFGGGGA